MPRYSLALTLLLFSCSNPAPTAEELLTSKTVKRSYFMECIKSYSSPGNYHPEETLVRVGATFTTVRNICFTYAQHMRRRGD